MPRIALISYIYLSSQGKILSVIELFGGNILVSAVYQKQSPFKLVILKDIFRNYFKNKKNLNILTNSFAAKNWKFEVSKMMMGL